MRAILLRLLLAAAVVLFAFALASPASAQQADEDPSPTSPHPQTPSTPTPSSPSQPSPSQKSGQTPQQGAQPSSPADPQTEDALAFTGMVTQEKNEIILRDPVTKMSYHFDDPSKAKPYLGKQIKVIGKLDMNSNTIHVNSVELLP